jgi:acyl-coenzyme A synthetase/AMP-(fatty) acid ligase
LVRNTNYIEILPPDRIGQASNASFDAATFEIWGALLNGASVVGIPKEMTLTPRELVSEITSKSINVLFLTTALFNQVAREVPDGFVSLRDLLFGGEAVDPQLVRRVLENGPPQRLLHVYGPTESTTFSSWYLVKSVPVEAVTVPIGSAISNTEIFVLDEARKPVNIGSTGELYIGGDGLATGYLNRPELTAERFVANPFDEASNARMYRTGDIGRLLRDGNIEFIGRVDSQIKLRGFRIELAEIESALLRHASVAAAAVLVRHDSAGEKILVAYIVPKDSTAPTLSDLRAHLKQSMPDYMIPAVFALVQTFPLTPNGKVDREALESMAAARVESGTAFVEPVGELEESLAAIWREVLSVERVGRDDNFFDLGGHSLSLARVHEQLMSMLCRSIPITVLFQHPTVGSLAKFVRERREGTKSSARLNRLQDRARKRKSVLAERAKHRSQVV